MTHHPLTPADPPEQTSLYQRLDLTAHYPYPKREYVGRLAWEVACTFFIRPSFRRAKKWRLWWLRKFGGHVHPTAMIRKSVRIWHPWLFELGEHSALADNVTVYNLGHIRIGKHTVLSQDVYLCAGTHDYTDATLPLVRSSITIGDGVWICAGAFIGPDVRIGNNVIVGARAVVTRDIPDGVIVAGNPARIVKQRPQPAEAFTRNKQTARPRTPDTPQDRVASDVPPSSSPPARPYDS